MNVEILQTEWQESIPKFDYPICKKGITIYEKKGIVELEDGISKRQNYLN